MLRGQGKNNIRQGRVQVHVPVAIHMRKPKARGSKARKLGFNFCRNGPPVHCVARIGHAQAQRLCRQVAPGVDEPRKRFCTGDGRPIDCNYVQAHRQGRNLMRQLNGFFPGVARDHETGANQRARAVRTNDGGVDFAAAAKIVSIDN